MTSFFSRVRPLRSRSQLSEDTARSFRGALGLGAGFTATGAGATWIDCEAAARLPAASVAVTVTV
jgi:hypothetical protein